MFAWLMNNSSQSEKIKNPYANNNNLKQLINFNVDGRQTFTFSIKKLTEYNDSLLYQLAFETETDNLFLDENGYIFLESCPKIFNIINDTMKGYEIRYQDLSIAMKEKLLTDAKRYRINTIITELEKELPNYSSESLNKWGSIIGKTVIACGLNLEHIYKNLTGNDMEFKLAKKLKQWLESDERIRNNVRKLVKKMLEDNCQKNNTIEALLIQLLSNISDEVDSMTILDMLFKHISPLK